jgi:hypothetical protein
VGDFRFDKKEGRGLYRWTERSRMCMRVSSERAKGMAGGRFGGRMAAGMRASLRRGFSVGLAPCSGKVAKRSIKGSGRTACSTEREFSTLTTAKDTKVTSNKISSTGMVFSTRMIR